MKTTPLAAAAAAAGDGPVYTRLSTRSTLVPLEREPGRFSVLRLGTAGTVIAVGPLADEVVAATLGLDVTVLYAATVRPFDGATLRDTLRTPDVVLVEPYLAGTSAAEVARRAAGHPAPRARPRGGPHRAAPLRHARRARARARARRGLAPGVDHQLPRRVSAGYLRADPDAGSGPGHGQPVEAQGRARISVT